MAGTLEVHAHGSGAVVTRRADGLDAARLAAIGRRLAQAAHPGVVQIVRSVGTDGAWELQLVHAGRPAELLAPLPPSQVAALAAAVAATLADLHAGGLVHGHLDASHVLVGAQGRPVLCGFGVDDGGAAPHDDVAALGALIIELLGSTGDTELMPEHRWRRRRSPDWSRRSLLLLADHACAEPPSRRPTAARLAASVASAVHDAQLVEPDDDALHPPAPSVPADPLDALRASSAAPAGERARRRSVVAAALAAVTLGGLVFAAGALRPPVQPTTASPPVAVSDRVTVRPSTTVVPSTAPPPSAPRARGPGRCPTAPPSGSPVGCGPVVIDGTVVSVGGHRFEVGQPGDRVVVGDWDCDGIVTAAALRPSTGEVFVFPSWTTGPDLVVPAVAEVTDGVDLVASATPATGADPCTSLTVRRRDGSLEAIIVRTVA